MPEHHDRHARPRSALASRPVTPQKATTITRAATTDRPGHVSPGAEADQLRPQVWLPRIANPGRSDRRFIVRVGSSLVHRAFLPSAPQTYGVFMGRVQAGPCPQAFRDRPRENYSGDGLTEADLLRRHRKAHPRRARKCRS